RSYIGIAGNEDFNYAEVKNAVLYLQKSKYDAEFIPFQGGHTWPLSDPVNKALRLLTLKAFTRGYLNNGALEVDEFYKKDIIYNKNLQSQNLFNWANGDLIKIMENYRFYKTPDSLKLA